MLNQPKGDYNTERQTGKTGASSCSRPLRYQNAWWVLLAQFYLAGLRAALALFESIGDTLPATEMSAAHNRCAMDKDTLALLIVDEPKALAAVIPVHSTSALLRETLQGQAS